MTWYLSGPMTGLDELNHPAFAHAASVLRSRGLTIASPHETSVVEGEWVDYLKADIRTLMNGDGIVLLRGWTRSAGAQLEASIAMRLGMPVCFFNDRTNELVDIA